MHPPSPSPSHKDTKQVGLGQGFSSNTTETEKIKALQACTLMLRQVMTSDHGVKMSDTDNCFNSYYSPPFSSFVRLHMDTST